MVRSPPTASFEAWFQAHSLFLKFRITRFLKTKFFDSITNSDSQRVSFEFFRIFTNFIKFNYFMGLAPLVTTDRWFKISRYPATVRYRDSSLSLDGEISRYLTIAGCLDILKHWSVVPGVLILELLTRTLQRTSF